MKLIIEIDKERYRDIQRIAKVQSYMRTQTAEQIIANGTPLEKLIDDIQCKIMHESCYIPDASEAVGMSKAIGIIEKYTKECEE